MRCGTSERLAGHPGLSAGHSCMADEPRFRGGWGTCKRFLQVRGDIAMWRNEGPFLRKPCPPQAGRKAFTQKLFPFKGIFDSL